MFHTFVFLYKEHIIMMITYFSPLASQRVKGPQWILVIKTAAKKKERTNEQPRQLNFVETLKKHPFNNGFLANRNPSPHHQLSRQSVHRQLGASLFKAQFGHCPAHLAIRTSSTGK